MCAAPTCARTPRPVIIGREADLQFEPGVRVGKYRLIAPIGRGGMGGVWQVEDDAGRDFALKSPAMGFEHDAELNRRFAREANALRLLDHPNLVAAVDVFVEAGRLFLVMERVTGRTLGKAMATGAFAPRSALVLGRQIVEGLGHAHAHGFVHRDLKPDNIMLIDMGGWERAKVIDFGLVKLLGDAEAALGGGKLTRTGTVSGTPAYMAPEQALGRIVDARADLYAVGVMLFELLTSRLPFTHADPAMLMRMHIKAPPPRLDTLAGTQAWCTPPLISLIDTALAKDPARRFPSAAAMRAALDDAFRSLDDVS
ncbi:MAG: serine/threonine protein kinase [Deltaproteobacteria bacterium]|nr:serine/threonine protein kinase [Deltaproteobacteria bacterium]